MTEVELKTLLAKLKITGNYPYTIPNTNITVYNDHNVKITSFMIKQYTFSSCDWYTYDDYWKKLLTQDIDYIDIDGISYNDRVNKLKINGKTFIYCISSKLYHSEVYLSDDLIHILLLDATCKTYAFLVLFRIDDFTMYGKPYKIKRRVNYPIFNIDKSGAKQIGVFNSKNRRLVYDKK